MKLIENINKKIKKINKKINNITDNKKNEIIKIENRNEMKTEIKTKTETEAILKILISILTLVMHNLLFNCVYAAFDLNVFIDNYVIKVLMFIIFVFLIIFAVKIYKMSKEEKKYTLEEMKELKKQNMVRGFEEIEKGKEINKDEKIDEGKKNIHEVILKNDNFVESSILEKKKAEELKEKENISKDKKKRKKNKKVQKIRDFIPTDSVVIKSKEDIPKEETNTKVDEEDENKNPSYILNYMGNNKKFEIQLDEELGRETDLSKEEDKKEEHNDIYNLISNKKKEKDELNEKISNMMFGVQNDSIHNELDDIIYNYKKRNLKTKIDTKQKAKTQEARINLNGMINKIVELNEQKDDIEENGISKEVTFEEIGREFQNELGENTKIILEEHKSNNND